MLVCTGRDWSQVESHVSVTTHRLGVAEVEAAVAPRQPVTMDLIDSASASLNVTVAVTKRMVFYPFFMHLAFFLFFLFALYITVSPSFLFGEFCTMQ